MTIARQDAERWLDGLEREGLITLIAEFYALKQNLCAQVLGIPTGTSDWVDRAIEQAENLRKRSNLLYRIIHRGLAELQEAQEVLLSEKCPNCRGEKTVGNETCVICHGLGRPAPV